MLPGYSPSGAIPRKHIHLGVFKAAFTETNPHTDNFTGVHAPPYTFSPVLERLPRFEAQADFSRALNGYPISQVVLDSTGKPRVYTDLRFKLRVTQPELEILVRLLHQIVWFIDSIHCDDAAEHAYFIRVMHFIDLTFEEDLDRHNNYQIVTVEFKDMDTIISRAEILSLLGVS